jgi:hypothetical protein
MAVRIIHAGVDEHFRVPVLERAGYSVSICTSVNSFCCSLTERPFADAVLISRTVSEEVLKVASSACGTSTIALIRFAEPDAHVSNVRSDYFNHFKFNLTIPYSAPNPEWIDRIEGTIECTRRLRAQLESQFERLTSLRHQSAALIADAAAEGKKSRLLLAKIEADRKLRRCRGKQTYSL